MNQVCARRLCRQAVDRDYQHLVRLNQCDAHFKRCVEDVKRGILQAGGFPLELPAMSLPESKVKPTTMLYWKFLAMETNRCRSTGRVRRTACSLRSTTIRSE